MTGERDPSGAFKHVDRGRSRRGRRHDGGVVIIMDIRGAELLQREEERAAWRWQGRSIGSVLDAGLREFFSRSNSGSFVFVMYLYVFVIFLLYYITFYALLFFKKKKTLCLC